MQSTCPWSTHEVLDDPVHICLVSRWSPSFCALKEIQAINTQPPLTSPVCEVFGCVIFHVAAIRLKRRELLLHGHVIQDDSSSGHVAGLSEQGQHILIRDPLTHPK